MLIDHSGFKNCSSRRQEALITRSENYEPPGVGCYNFKVYLNPSSLTPFEKKKMNVFRQFSRVLKLTN